MLLGPIPSISVAFCKYVYLNSKRFESDLPMHIQLTITWRNQTFKEGAAVWGENVTTSGFNACVLVAGRKFLGGALAPTVFWMAYQKGLLNSSEGQLIGGFIDIPSWFSGSTCQRLPGIYNSQVNLFCLVNPYKYMACALLFITRFLTEGKHLYSHQENVRKTSVI